MENRVYLAVADRAGQERGSTFLGRSQLVDVRGTVVAEAGADEEILYADFDLALARQKDFVYAAGASRRTGSATGALTCTARWWTRTSGPRRADARTKSP